MLRKYKLKLYVACNVYSMEPQNLSTEGMYHTRVSPFLDSNSTWKLCLKGHSVDTSLQIPIYFYESCFNNLCEYPVHTFKMIGFMRLLYQIILLEEGKQGVGRGRMQ